MNQLTKPQKDSFQSGALMKRNRKRYYPEGTIFTKIKFKKSEETGKLIGFVYEGRNGRIKGVREDSDYPKKIVVIDPLLSPFMKEGVLYCVALQSMKGDSNGYKVIDAKVMQFRPTFEISYVPKAVYTIVINIGYKRLKYDPKDGSGVSKSIKKIKELIMEREDVINPEHVCFDFEEIANDLLNRMEHDGFYVQRGA